MSVGRVISAIGLVIAVVGVIGGRVARARRRRVPPLPELVRPALPANTTAVEVPSLGSGVTSVVVVRIAKRLGEPVIAGEPVMELSTDKADVEVPSSVPGIVAAVFVQPNDEVPVGFPVLAIREVSRQQRFSRRAPQS
jgi:biotin carboxyl carrier protein